MQRSRLADLIDSPINLEVVTKAGEAILDGALVAFPTESFYGLAVNPKNPAAVRRLAKAKGRNAANPFALIAASLSDVECLGGLNEPLRLLAQAFWPGPLTIAFNPKGMWPKELIAPNGTIAVRISDFILAQELAAAAGGLITATSANRTGCAPAKEPSQLGPDLTRFIDILLDGGVCAGGRPSTVLGLNAQNELQIFRPGAISAAEIVKVSKTFGLKVCGPDGVGA